MIKFILFFLLTGVVGCQTGVVPISQRGVGGFDKPGTAYMHGRSPGRKEQPELFVKSDRIEIAPKNKQSDNGSLFKIDDQRNYYFTSNAPYSVNQYVDINVVPVQREKKDEPEKPAAEETANQDQFVKEMLANLPELEPADGGPSLLKKLKFKIAHVYNNGDALAVLKRSSSKGVTGKEVNVRARIPYTSLISGRALNTADLVDVHWLDNLDGQPTERYSSGWEDEYSLRISGFNEAKSLYAQQLDDKKKQLTGVREKLRNQLESLGKERQKLAKEREQWFEAKAKAEQKSEELEKKVEAQQEELEELRPPEEKPGDLKDGATGA